jgi:hypothetical protein
MFKRLAQVKNDLEWDLSSFKLINWKKVVLLTTLQWPLDMARRLVAT